MYPFELFFGIDLYMIFIFIGVILALVVFSIYSKKLNMSYKLGVFSLAIGNVSIILGYLSAILFQSFYDYLKTGNFVFGSNATFYGGLIGGALTFLLCYFVIGKIFFKDNEHIKEFDKVSSIAACSIMIAHGMGRIGCLMAGCCHGKVTDSIFGINMYIDTPLSSISEVTLAKVIPTQLYEAIFLFMIFTIFSYLLIKKRRGTILGYYLSAYGVWRFFIEYLRDDDRGKTIIPFLTPSQLIAILMIIIGALYILFIHKSQKEKKYVTE